LPAPRLERAGAAAAADGGSSSRRDGRAMSLADPRLAWLVLLAPLAAAFAGWLWRRRLRAVAAWASRGLWERLLPGYRPARLVLTVTLVALAIAGTALAL